MQNIIFDKTDKGREEIISRKYRLANRLRTLLVMVDGKQSGKDLLEKVIPLGLTQESLAELEINGFIQRPGGTSSQFADTLTLEDIKSSQINSVELFQVLHNFYSEAIKQHLGIRGYNLQFVVERASTLQDFHELRAPFLDAINKTQSGKKALELRDQLDELLSRVPNKSKA